MPKKFKKKPVIIEAMQWTGVNWREIDEFVTVYHETNPKAGVILIETLEGLMRADIGSYIIRGVNGEFYPCKEDVFHKTYEAVNDDD